MGRRGSITMLKLSCRLHPRAAHESGRMIITFMRMRRAVLPHKLSKPSSCIDPHTEEDGRFASQRNICLL